MTPEWVVALAMVLLVLNIMTTKMLLNKVLSDIFELSCKVNELRNGLNALTALVDNQSFDIERIGQIEAPEVKRVEPAKPEVVTRKALDPERVAELEEALAALY